jgi:hypothetical protein
MNAKTKNILVGVAICVSGGLLAMISISSTAKADGKSVTAATAAADRFASNAHYCKAFNGAQGVGTDGVSADFSAALGEAIHANGGDAKRTFTMIREKCSTVA